MYLIQSHGSCIRFRRQYSLPDNSQYRKAVCDRMHLQNQDSDRVHIHSVRRQDGFLLKRQRQQKVVFQEGILPFAEFFDIKGKLRQVDQVRSRTVFTLRQCGGSGSAACVASHDLTIEQVLYYTPDQKLSRMISFTEVPMYFAALP